MAAADRFDPYRILGVRHDATQLEVARAYRLLAKRFHPDLHGPDASRHMRDLNRSWQILSDPDRRRAWEASHPAQPPAAPHWTARSRPSRHDPSPATPRDWGAWEVGRPATAAGPDRVRVTDTWPRPPSPAAPATAGLRDSGWLAAAVAGALVIAIVALGWLASVGTTASTARQAIGQLGITPTARVPLDPEHELAVYRAPDGRFGIVTAWLEADGWEARVLDTGLAGGRLSVRLALDDSGNGWQSVVYGLAAPGVELVRLVGVDGQGGDVANGTWAIGVRDALHPEQLRWQFELGDGSVLLSGMGELN